MTSEVPVRPQWRRSWVLAALAGCSLAGFAAAQNVSPAALRTARFLNGRRSPASSSSAKFLDLARRQHLAMLAQPRSSILTAAWTAVGPNQVASAEFGEVTGRVTAIAIDPADATGNTVYVGTTGGGVWKSTNAAGPAALVSFAPLTDTLTVFDSASGTIPSLSIGSLAIANGVILAGTGDPNDATDSYYGAGILRSADGGVTWTVAQQSLDGVAGNHSFFGLSAAGLAFSSLNPSLAVAAVSQAAEGTLVDAASATGAEMGLFYSSDAGLTWHMGTIVDGSQTVQSPLSANNNGGNAATSVVWNPMRQEFLAAVRYHGYYSSPDGVTWARLPNQPGTGLTAAACPPTAAGSGNPSCPIFRGALAVQPVTGDTFALSVDADNVDQGLYQDACALNGTACGNSKIAFGTQLNSSALQGAGAVIAQADYNLALAAAPVGTDTALYVGAIDLYRCTLAGGCSLRNTTNAGDGCTNPAMVAPAQHAIATLTLAGVPLLFVGNDGGLWRSTDGVNETAAPCSLNDAAHFQNLNPALGSLAEVVSFAQSPNDSSTLLAGLGGLGTAGTSTVTNPWEQLSAGEGGGVAIDAANPAFWYVSTGAGVSISRCTRGSACTASDFAANVIGAAQVADDPAAIHAAWLLDPGLTSNLIVGTCRAWRGPAAGGAAWSSSNLISAPFGAAAASACASVPPVVRTLAAGGAVGTSVNAQNAGSEVIYAGLAGVLDGGQSLGGHLFVTAAANLASASTLWTDAAASPVTNDAANASAFNPDRFDISSIAVDSHDATGATVYATIMGFATNGLSTPHLYRSVDRGAHWTQITANLPAAPANSVVVDPNDANTLYIATDTGVYVTTQVTTCATANCWSVYGVSLPNSPVIQLAAAAAMPTGDGRLGELRAATYGRGIWQIPLLTASAPAAPAMAINPSAVTYTAQQVGTASASVTITVTNTGNAVLVVSSVVASGDFAQTNSCVGGPIAQNGTCSVQVSFLPSAAGMRTGLLTIYANVAGGQATASLSGIGTPAAAIVLTPTALTFSSTSVGAVSAVQNITVSNTGGTSATLQTLLVSGDFTISADTCGATLAPSTGCTISIVFAPAATGTRSGTLTIADSAGTQVATLTGIATNPATDTLAPLALTFSAQQLNTASAGQQITLTNAGGVALSLIAARIVSGDFIAVNNCGSSLAPNSTCAITVTFAPKSVGQQNGSLSVSDQFRTQTVALTGTGLAPPGVSLSPANALAFGAVGLGFSAPAQTVTLTNNGGVPLAISSIAATGDFTLVTGSNTCGGSLAPAAICTVQVVFTPTTAGPRTGTVTFTDNAANSPQTLALTGTGIDFALASNGPASITINSGQSATYALLLTSTAGLPGSVAFTCAGVPAHSVCTVNPVSAGLGTTANVSVTIATGVAGASLERPAMPWTRKLVWLAVLLPFGLACRRRLRPTGLLMLVAMVGCSTGRTIPASTSPGQTVVVTPSGTSTIVVAGASAGVVHSVNLTLIVQ
jgi:hypothetical protein